MNLSNFNKEELTIVESFLQVANRINNIYDNLYKLELANKKDSNEYIKELEMLKEALKTENKKYKNANLTVEQKFKIIELLSNTPNSVKNNDINSIINQDDSDKLNRRIINILVNQAVTDKDYSSNAIPKEVFELLEEIGISINHDEISKDINNQSKIELAINNDITLVFLAILQETSLLFKYSNYKNQLQKTIYRASFINKDIENQLIDNKFNIPKNIYTSSKFINDLLKTETYIYNIMLNIIIQTQINSHIITLLEIKDEEYNDPNANISSIINQCYIRALLTFMTDEEIYKLNEQFHELIETPSYLIKHPKDRISEEAIIRCFKNIKYDKAKKRTISLNKNNHN